MTNLQTTSISTTNIVKCVTPDECVAQNAFQISDILILAALVVFVAICAWLLVQMCLIMKRYHKMQIDVDKSVKQTSSKLEDSLTRLDEAESSYRDIESQIGSVSAKLELTSGTGTYPIVPVDITEDSMICIKVTKRKEPDATPPVCGYLKPIYGCANFAVPEQLPPLDRESIMSIRWAYSDFRRGKVVVVDGDTLAADAGHLYFVGDIHGDSDTLRKLLESVFRHDDQAKIIFLGDIFDRGLAHLECVRMVAWTAKTHPGAILWLAGNHDVALSYNDDTGQFMSGVEPAEFKSWLNEHRECTDEGRAVCSIAASLPIAAVLGDIWVSHGGVLHSDVTPRFERLEDMDKDMENDCIWSRMVDVKKKRANRNGHGAEIGRENTLEFLHRLREKEGLDIRHIVCAHQHIYSEGLERGIGYRAFVNFFSSEPTCECITSFQTANGGRPVMLHWTDGKSLRPEVL